MPTDKDFKRLVRGRMQKTGESYTAARAQLRKTKPAISSSAPRPARYAAIAGKSDTLSRRGLGAIGSAGSRRWTAPRRRPGPTARSRSTSWRSTGSPAGGLRR